jgi:hypothetical protein
MPWLLLIGAGVSSVFLAAAPEKKPGAIDLPDGASFQIPALPFARPVVRQAAGLDKQWQEAGAAYQTGDYARSARLFLAIEDAEGREPERHDAALFRGIALLMDGRHDEAAGVLGRASELAKKVGLPHAVDSFYIGVTAVARGELELARRALGEALDGPFDRDARSLLSSLAPR